MNKPTVQDIFQCFYLAYLEKYSPSPEQAKVARNILNCKTGAYGANVSVCEDCGAVQVHYNSCRNRCCPMCQAVPKEIWMDARREDVLDAPYFHLVFTVPDILNPIIYSNQKLLYDTLYHAASATISELTADPKHLGANVGYICILHTWGSEMNFHPHIHLLAVSQLYNMRIILFLSYNPYFIVSTFITISNKRNITWFSNTTFFNISLYLGNR